MGQQNIAVRRGTSLPRLRSPEARSEVAVRARCVEFAAEAAANRCDDHGHVPGGLTALIAPDVALAGVDLALAGPNNLLRARRVVTFVEGDLTLDDGAEYGPGCVCQPVDDPAA